MGTLFAPWCMWGPPLNSVQKGIHTFDNPPCVLRESREVTHHFAFCFAMGTTSKVLDMNPHLNSSRGAPIEIPAQGQIGVPQTGWFPNVVFPCHLLPILRSPFLLS